MYFHFANFTFTLQRYYNRLWTTVNKAEPAHKHNRFGRNRFNSLNYIKDDSWSKVKRARCNADV